MSCIPVVVEVGCPGNIGNLGNRLGPTPEPVWPSASRGSSLDPPVAWVLGSGARAHARTVEPGLVLALTHGGDWHSVSAAGSCIPDGKT